MSNKNKIIKAETATEPKPDTIASYANKASSWGNLLVGISGLSYALGFIIVNVYLATNYGIYSFEIFNTHYIYAGATFLLLCLFAYFGASSIYNKMQEIRHEPFLKRIGEFIGLLAWVHSWYLAGILAITFIAQIGEVNSLEDIFANFPIAVWFPLAILAFYAQIQFVKKWSWEKIPYDVPFPSAILTNIIFLAVLYGVQFYFYLPPSLGGGLPTPVTLLVDTNKVEAAKQLLPITSQNPSVTVFLIEQTNDSLYVLVDNQPDANHMLYPVQIDKSIIVGAIYPKKIKPSGRLDFGNIRSTSTSVPTLTPTETSIP